MFFNCSMHDEEIVALFLCDPFRISGYIPTDEFPDEEDGPEPEEEDELEHVINGNTIPVIDFEFWENRENN